jgi:hypothetical protein
MSYSIDHALVGLYLQYTLLECIVIASFHPEPSEERYLTRWYHLSLAALKRRGSFVTVVLLELSGSDATLYKGLTRKKTRPVTANPIPVKLRLLSPDSFEKRFRPLDLSAPFGGSSVRKGIRFAVHQNRAT